MAMALLFQILDHGCDGEQYFPGCGVAFTQYEHVVTGIGNSAREAAEDAAEQFYTMVDRSDLAVCDAEALDKAIENQDAAVDTDPDDPETSPEWHHYVSIRWKFWDPSA